MDFEWDMDGSKQMPVDQVDTNRVNHHILLFDSIETNSLMFYEDVRITIAEN